MNVKVYVPALFTADFLYIIFKCALQWILAYFLCFATILCQVTSVMSDSLWPHGLLLTRLFSPWDSPDKNAGVGCHFLLQGFKPAFPVAPTLQLDSLPLSHKESIYFTYLISWHLHSKHPAPPKKKNLLYLLAFSVRTPFLYPLTTSNKLSFSMEFPNLSFSYNKITQYAAFWSWLLLVNINFQCSLILQHLIVLLSFLSLNTISLCGFTTFIYSFISCSFTFWLL